MSRCVALLGPMCSGTPDTNRQAVAHKLHIPLNRTYPRKVDKSDCPAMGIFGDSHRRLRGLWICGQPLMARSSLRLNIACCRRYVADDF